MAEQLDDLYWRRQAIRLRRKGWCPRQILTRIPRKREWLRKWWQRFTRLGWQGLYDRARRPVHTPQAYTQHAHTVVLRVRQALEQRIVGLVGAQAVQQELRDHRLLEEVPALATSKRWLSTAGITQSLIEEKKPERSYPAPEQAPQVVGHACDWIARYLEGGAKVFVFHTVDLQTRALNQTIRADKTVISVRTHLLSSWQTLGLPHRLYLDNDAAFTGGGELTIDAAHGLVFGDKQASQILREMAAGWFIGEEIAKLNQQLFHHLWDGNDSGHRSLPSHALETVIGRIIHKPGRRRKFAKPQY